MADESKTKVVILTRSYRIRGHIHLLPGARITDFLVDSKDFIAVTDADVWETGGRQVLSSAFINIARDQIEIVMPG